MVAGADPKHKGGCGARTKPIEFIIVSVDRAMTKLISHCVAAAMATFRGRSRAVGISET